MALGSAFVDRGRTVRRTKAHARIQGTKPYRTDKGDWFRCRITIPKGSETHEEGRDKARKQPQLQVARRDTKGNLVGIEPYDEVEIKSAQFGTVIYQVAGAPEPLRKRRTVIGWQMDVTKVET